MKFNELWEQKSYPIPAANTRTRHPFASVLAFLTIPVIIGVLFALMIAPYALGAGAVAKTAPEIWDAVDADTSSFDDISAPQAVVLKDKDGKEFARFYAESRIPLTYEDMGDNIINALVDTEDVRFWGHKGVDDQGVARAAVKTMLGGHEGASTITMQLVQNLRQVVASYSDDDAAYARAQASTATGKIQEMKYAIEFEKKHSKKEILESYLNTVYFGNGFYGIGAASQGYFSKDAKDLTVPEAAVIAGLVQNPNGYNPVENPEAAKDRRDAVIGRMLAAGTITQSEADEYTSSDLDLNVNKKPVGNSGCSSSQYPYFCELSKEELLSSDVLGKDDETRAARFYAGGFDVVTSLDRKVISGLEDAAHNFQSDPYNTGLAEVEPNTGLIRGIAQSTSFKDTQVVYAKSKLQTGSIFKPITIAAAVDAGVNPYQTFNVTDGYVSPSLDSPVGGYKNSMYTVGNMDLPTAVKYSNNVFFVKLIEQVGVRTTAATARALGLSSVPNNLTGREGSLTLGAYEASPIEISNAFATFASGGIHCSPHTLVSVGGKNVDNSCQRVISAKAAETVNSVLTQPLTAGGTADTLSFNADVRVKSGSTDDYSVLWLNAYTPKGSVAGWVADPDNPNANPVRNVNVYGVYHAVGHGGDTAGKVVNRAFNSAGIGSAKYPPATSSGDIIQKTENAPEVKGMRTNAAISVLISSGRDITVSDDGGSEDVVRNWDEETGVLSVSGNSDINGFKFYVDDNGNTVKEEPNR